jgi:CheY-like chemotaxis protein
LLRLCRNCFCTCGFTAHENLCFAPPSQNKDRRKIHFDTKPKLIDQQIKSDQLFDLLICDIGLPDGTGHDVIKQLLLTRKFPAIALSGFGMAEDIKKSKDSGFHEHLTKPVSIQQLKSAIDNIFMAGSS